MKKYLLFILLSTLESEMREPSSMKKYLLFILLSTWPCLWANLTCMKKYLLFILLSTRRRIAYGSFNMKKYLLFILLSTMSLPASLSIAALPLGCYILEVQVGERTYAGEFFISSN